MKQRSRKQPLVSIIVATVNTPRLTNDCLSSVIKHTTVPYELIVVNNSRARAIRKCLQGFEGIRLIQNSRNVGYTKAANQGALASRGEFLCFLNTDTVVPPRWAERLLKAAKRPGVGAVGPNPEGDRCQYPMKDQRVREALTALKDSALENQYGNSTQRARWLSGFCLVIPRAVMTRVGLFDERFFFGWEDPDYSFRLRLQGYKLLYVKSVFIPHEGGGSIPLPKRRRWVRKSQKLFLEKWRFWIGRQKIGPKAMILAIDRRLQQYKPHVVILPSPGNRS